MAQISKMIKEIWSFFRNLWGLGLTSISYKLILVEFQNLLGKSEWGPFRPGGPLNFKFLKDGYGEGIDGSQSNGYCSGPQGV